MGRGERLEKGTGLGVILAAASCDPAKDIICAPSNVLELFEFKTEILGIPFFTRTTFLIFFAMALVVAFLYFGLRKKEVIPGRFQSMAESTVTFVKLAVRN